MRQEGLARRSGTVLWLGDDECHDASLVGGKAANLSRLAAVFTVPPGFCLLANGDASAALAPGGPLHDAYGRLAESCAADAPVVAVRSSAVDEDGATASFAGQHETYLGVSGFEAVADAVERCWASGRSPRALEYRRQHGLPAPNGPLPVLVQRLVIADVSAVVFSANPVTGARWEIVIDASWGLGESIVGGTVTPDTYTVSRDGFEIVSRRIAEKRRMTVSVPGGSLEVDVPAALRRTPALDDDAVRDVARLVAELDDDFGRPVDVECAWADGRLHLLQCRPITTLDKE